MLDEGVVAGDLVILEPGLHPLLEVGDVHGALLLAHVAADKQREFLGDDVGKVNKRWPVSRITWANTSLFDVFKTNLHEYQIC